MPIYIVRWPNLSAALVRAKDEGELFWILDQEADPSQCVYKKYTGPIFIDIDLKPEYSQGDGEGDGRIIGPGNMEGPYHAVLTPCAENGDMMMDEIRQFAFPHLQAEIDNLDIDDEELTTGDILPELEADLNSMPEGERFDIDEIYAKTLPVIK